MSERDRDQVARVIGEIREREGGREREGDRGKKIGSPTRTEIGSKP